MYNYIFDADFVCGLPATSLILSAIINCVNKFNSVTRPAYKCLSVSINAWGGLSYNLTSSIPIDRKNWLRSCQYFSKELSKDPIMSKYICPNRLLKR